MVSPKKEHWIHVMQEEFDSLLKLETNKSVDHYEVRLVAKGFTRKEGVDFNVTFSLVVKFDSIKIMFSIAAAEDMNITQFDVYIVFLYGEIEEDIYMTQPLGFENIKEARIFL
jgi:hypothetical protein